jgi:hypothetical protein
VEHRSLRRILWRRGELTTTAIDDAGKGAHQLGAGLLEFAGVKLGERTEDSFALGSDAEQNAAVVVGVLQAAKEALLDRSVDEFDSAVVLEEHALGHIRYAWFDAGRHGGDALQHLILLGAHAGFAHGKLADVVEAPELIAEFSKAAEMEHVELGGRLILT